MARDARYRRNIPAASADSIMGKPEMARDLQVALTALNRFGFGARGASTDLAAVAADPRGFIKADLTRGGVQLGSANLQPTPSLAVALFAYQAEQKEKREAVKANAKEKAEAKDMT